MPNFLSKWTWHFRIQACPKCPLKRKELTLKLKDCINYIQLITLQYATFFSNLSKKTSLTIWHVHEKVRELLPKGVRQQNLRCVSWGVICRCRTNLLSPRSTYQNGLDWFLVWAKVEGFPSTALLATASSGSVEIWTDGCRKARFM